MKKIYLLMASVLLTVSSFAQLRLTTVSGSAPLGFSGDGGIAEITAFDPITKQLYVINGDLNIVVYDFSNPNANPLPTVTSINIPGSGPVNSLACRDGILAIAYAAPVKTDNGFVQLVTTTGNSLIGAAIQVGALPDMLTFTPDGNKILVANEGEPNNTYTIDPEGSVSIIDITNINSPTLQTISLTSLNGTIPHLSTFPKPIPSIRIFGMKNSLAPTDPNYVANNVKTATTVAEDLEPEYIAVSPDGNTAWVVCQDNGALLVIDIPSATLTTIMGFGYKDHNIAGNGFDASRTPTNAASVNIRTWPVKGMYQPDAISVVTFNGVPYLFTANEGDAREWGTGFDEEYDINAAFGGRIVTTANPAFTPATIAAFTATGMRISRVMGVFDAPAGSYMPNSATGQNINIGNMYSEIYTYGARSFSVWNGLTGELVWDSKDQLEQITYRLFPNNFNADHNGNNGNNVRRRSTTKGPEPESIVTGKIGDSTYAFIGLERIGGVIVYNITNPTAPYFRQYINPRNFSLVPNAGNNANIGDLGPEGLLLISENDSPDGNNYLVVSNEVSGTIRTYLLDYNQNIVKSKVNPFIVPVNAVESLTQAITLSGTNFQSPLTVSASGDFRTSLNTVGGFGVGTQITFSGNSFNTVLYIKYLGADALQNGTLSFVDNAGKTATDLALTGIKIITTTGAADYTLQVLHGSDFEAGILALETAPKFVAIWNKFNGDYANTLRVSGGDNYLPSPFFNAAADDQLRPTFSNINRAFLGSGIGTNIREGIGRADINIMNLLDLHASAVGNHEFDAGTGTFAEIIAMQYNDNAAPTQVRWMGTRFPYLSANLDFSADANIRNLYTSEIRNTSTYKNAATSEASVLNSTFEDRKKIAPATIATIGGQEIGIVGATTQIVEKISSTGGVRVIGTNVDDMPLLASQLQPVIDDLRNRGINKIVILSHLQQITLEKALAPLLSGVDIIVSAGSHTLMANPQNDLEGDVAVEPYPFLAKDKDNNTTLIVCTESEYKYVGRLVVDFDANGNVITTSLDPAINGAWKSSNGGLLRAGVNTVTAFSGTSTAQLTRGLIEGVNQLVNNVTITGITATVTGIRPLINAQDGNIFGKTQVFLEGRREQVRLQETNLGNLSSDANLAEARKLFPDVMVSFKNGGGIRAAIGTVSAVGSNFVLTPPLANASAGKAFGDVSQLDILNSLRFNNSLSVGEMTATNILATLNHAVRASGPGVTPGQFAQVGGISFSWNPSLAAGSRVRNVAIINQEGRVVDVIAENGVIVGDPNRKYKAVTLSFLVSGGGAGSVGGDSYPLNTATFENRIDLNASLTVNGYNANTGAASFGAVGGEQDAFAKFMKSNYSTTGYNVMDTPEEQDRRIQNLSKRTDAVLPDFNMPIATFSGFVNQVVALNGISISGSNLAVPISVMAPNNVSVNGMSMVTVNGMGGLVNIQALMPANASTVTAVLTLTAASLTKTFTHTVVAALEPVNPTATFNNATVTIGGGNLNLTTLVTTNSNGAQTFSVVAGTAASVSGTILTPVSVGTVQVSFSTAATSTFNAASVTAIITVVDAPVVVVPVEPSLTVIGGPFTYTRVFGGGPTAEMAQMLTIMGENLTGDVMVSSSLEEITFADSKGTSPLVYVNPISIAATAGKVEKVEVTVRFVSTVAGTYTGTVMVSTAGANTFSTDVTATVSYINSVADFSSVKGLAVYPNPVTDGVLYFSQPISGVVFNSLGVVVKGFDNASLLQVADLPKGLYMLQVGTKTIKFEIQ